MKSLILYILACICVGIIWQDRKIGFFGITLLSMILTPVLVALILLVSSPKEISEEARP